MWESGTFSFEGALSVERGDGWVCPWRIDWERRDYFPYLKDDGRPHWSAPPARQCSGIRLTFAFDGESLALDIAEPEKDLVLDLYINSRFRESVSPRPGDTVLRFSPLEPGMKQVEIWLDQRHAFLLRSLIVDEWASVAMIPPARKRWIHYGSSISHARQAESPSRTWASRAARRMDLHLTNLGFASHCVMEPMVARLIRDLPADYITLKLGINTYEGPLSRRTFQSSVIGMVQIIREKHPETPLALISPIISPSRESERGWAEGLSLREMRQCLRETTDICKAYGDRRICYVEGLRLFGAEDRAMQPDGVHPDDRAQPIMADRFIDLVFKEGFSQLSE